MSDIKLSEHRFHKGKFISPWNDMGFTMTQTPWFQRRLPEYLWIGLILDKYGRSDGLQICGRIIQQIKKEQPHLCRLKKPRLGQYPQSRKMFGRIPQSPFF